MKNVVILSVVAVSITAFAYFAIFSTPAYRMANEAKETEEALSVGQSAVVARPEPRQGTGTLEFLRLLDEDLECVVSYSDTETKQVVEGTYFVSDNNMRGDFLTEAPDLSGQVLSSMIIDGANLYIWSDIEGQLYGMKVSLATMNDSVIDIREPVALDAAVQYNCKPWPNVDRTIFIPPTSVIFQDINQLQRAGMEYGTVY